MSIVLLSQDDYHVVVKGQRSFQGDIGASFDSIFTTRRVYGPSPQMQHFQDLHCSLPDWDLQMTAHALYRPQRSALYRPQRSTALGTPVGVKASRVHLLPWMYHPMFDWCICHPFCRDNNNQSLYYRLQIPHIEPACHLVPNVERARSTLVHSLNLDDPPESLVPRFGGGYITSDLPTKQPQTIIFSLVFSQKLRERFL